MNYQKSGWLLAALFSFTLVAGGAAAQEQKEGSAPDSKQEAKQEASKGDASIGKQVFEANCLLCHNADSSEANIGPGLKDLFHWPPHKLADGTEHKEHTVAIIRDQIVKGSSTMPPAGAALSEEEITNLIAYLQTL